MSWLIVQTEEEIKAEAQKKMLKATRLKELHAFKDAMAKRIAKDGSISTEEKHKMFAPYFKRCKFDSDEARQCLFSQTLQKAMNMKTSDEKKHNAREIYTDRNGFTDNIRTSNNKIFLEDVGETHKRKAEKNMETYRTCKHTMNNIGKAKDEQVTLIKEKTGTEE